MICCSLNRLSHGDQAMLDAFGDKSSQKRVNGRVVLQVATLRSRRCPALGDLRWQPKGDEQRIVLEQQLGVAQADGGAGIEAYQALAIPARRTSTGPCNPSLQGVPGRTVDPGPLVLIRKGS